jgi:exodeoxyribonuclease V gamma subunit
MGRGCDLNADHKPPECFGSHSPTASSSFSNISSNVSRARTAPPLTAQQVIIPSAAVRRRVELAGADRHGIFAHIDFSYLGQWLWTQIGRLVDVQDVSPFSPPALLTWRVFEILGDASFTGEYARLAGYLRNADPVMRLDLAERSAQLIEHYITYRPQWLAAWSDGKRAGIPALGAASAADELWQAALWRRITGELGTGRQHPAAVFFQRIAQLGADAPAQAGLPAQVSIFCLSTLPPLYLDILRQLSRWIDIQAYTLNPCREYWFEIVDRKRLSYLAARARDAHHEVGNALLAAWGKQTQAQIDLLLSDAGAIVEEDSLFLPAAGQHLLARVQNTILDLDELAPGSITLAADDRSIEVHVCHSPTRELEVLHDQLLAELAGADPVTPDQILVLLPDLPAAAPLIDAVFGTAPAETPHSLPDHGPAADQDQSDRPRARSAARHLQQPLHRQRRLRPAATAAGGGQVRPWQRRTGVRPRLDPRRRYPLGTRCR